MAVNIKHTQRVVILMATYNGEKYLTEQINSLISQSYDNWLLVIRDDGSVDNTLNIINDFVNQDPRISLLTDSLGNSGSPLANFSHLLLHAKQNFTDQYYMFCDQDDVWFENKIERMVFTAEKEPQKELQSPLLIHCDLVVVDENLNLISSSFMQYQQIKHHNKKPLKHLITQNFVTGCATLFNRKLLELAAPVNSFAVMHDWWLALLASSSGKVLFIKQPLIKYRQHSSNQVGALGFWHQLNPFSSQFKNLLLNAKLNLINSFEQSKALLNSINQQKNYKITSDQKLLLHSYSTLKQQNRFNRLIICYRLGIFKSTIIYNILFFSLLLVLKKEPHKNE